jgi:hypothetical protein
MMPATNIASDFDASTTPFPVAAIRDDNCLATCKHVVAPRPLVIIAQGMRPIAVIRTPQDSSSRLARKYPFPIPDRLLTGGVLFQLLLTWETAYLESPSSSCWTLGWTST